MGNRVSNLWCKNSSLQIGDNNKNKSEREQSHNRSGSGFFKSSGSRRMSLNCVSRKSKPSAKAAEESKDLATTTSSAAGTKTGTTTETFIDTNKNLNELPITTNTTAITTTSALVGDKATRIPLEAITGKTNTPPAETPIRTTTSIATTTLPSSPSSLSTATAAAAATTTKSSSARNEAIAETIRNLIASTASETSRRRA
ncbi:unnamed protein product [Ceratitis capitata]|uniref:(Mediterranean fruit fly) hypothetical protein n=1 Tax=Ceratitis capitata TaxID=7213 RepID=A0A811UUK3_CERCA|nr:unnamed protein product [Ceratitis capitata]